MFRNLFSFQGRIRRTEYGISFIIYAICYVITLAVLQSESTYAGIGILALVPLLWFLWSQGAKRCHDVGNSGWYQLIPFYFFVLIFQEGRAGDNQYGENPKAVNDPFDPYDYKTPYPDQQASSPETYSETKE